MKQEDASGQDLDVWGGEVTTPVLIPKPGGVEDCKLKDRGGCPIGCQACLLFAEEMKLIPAQSARGL